MPTPLPNTIVRHILVYSATLTVCLSLQAQKAPAPNPPSLTLASQPAIKARSNASAELSAQILSIPSIEWVLHKTENGEHPSGNEQAMLWLMNRARSNPEKEGLFLADTGSPNVASAISQYTVDLDVMKAEFAAIPSSQPAAFDRRLYDGSEVHSLDLISRDTQDHNNQLLRIIDAEFKFGTVNASVFSYAENALHSHAAFNIDWGNGTPDGMQIGRGHRAAIMDSGFTPLTNIGISMISEDNQNSQVGPLVTSIAYASASTSFQDHFNKLVVGTVWNDTNENGIYDNDEGLSGVTVMPDSGSYFAVTGDAGGYAIPVPANGTYTITFSGDALDSPQRRTVTVEGKSVLVPWNQADSHNEVALFTALPPKLLATQTTNGIEISWTELSGQDYTLQKRTPTENWTDDKRLIDTNDSLSTFLITNLESANAPLFRILITESTTTTSSPN